MQENQRHRPLHPTPLMHKMHIKRPEMLHLDIRRELRHLVQLRFSFAPVELCFPVRGEAFDVGEGGAVFLFVVC